VARAKSSASELEQKGISDNPFLDLEGLEAWVSPLS
jgi:hypothetical protein